MRHSILSLVTFAVILTFSSAMLAQHAGGGGSGSSGGSSGGGGGGHSGGSGGSNSSGGGGGHSSGGSGGGHSAGSSGGHSSGASVPHGSGSHASSVGGSDSGWASSHSGKNSVLAHPPHYVVEPDGHVHEKPVPPEKKSPFSFLRRPFQHEPKKPELRRRCMGPECRTCPAGGVMAGGQCVTTVAMNRGGRYCTGPGFRVDCFQYGYVTDDCSGLRRLVDGQAQRVQAAEAARESACIQPSDRNAALECVTSGKCAFQKCTAASAKAESEANLHQKLLEQYQSCRQRTLTAHPFGTSPAAPSSHAPSFDPFRASLDHP